MRHNRVRKLNRIKGTKNTTIYTPSSKCKILTSSTQHVFYDVVYTRKNLPGDHVSLQSAGELSGLPVSLPGLDHGSSTVGKDLCLLHCSQNSPLHSAMLISNSTCLPCILQSTLSYFQFDYFNLFRISSVT